MADALLVRMARAGVESIGDGGWLPAGTREEATERELTRAKAMLKVVVEELKSDDCYYDVADASQTWSTAITQAADWLLRRGRRPRRG